MRCYITVEGGEGYVADIRLRPGDPKTSITPGAKPVPAGEEVALAVPDDELEGTGAMIVVLDEDGNTVAQRQTTIGGE